MINFNFKRFLALIVLLVVSFSLNAKTLKIGARATPSIDPHFGFLTTNIAYNAHIYGFIVGKNDNSRKKCVVLSARDGKQVFRCQMARPPFSNRPQEVESCLRERLFVSLDMLFEVKPCDGLARR